jgi:hypothetical protein
VRNFFNASLAILGEKWVIIKAHDFRGWKLIFFSNLVFLEADIFTCLYPNHETEIHNFNRPH